MQRPLAAASLAKATRRLFVSGCIALSIVAASTACNPTFNWREFRSPDGFAVMLPGRPQTVTREVKLPDTTVQMSMTSTGIGATLFAVGAAQLPAGLSAEPEARQRTIAHMRDALVRNVGGSIVKTSAAALPVPTGDSRKVLATEAVEASGQESGRAVQLTARLFIVGDRLFQVVALGAKGEMSPDALDTFFTSFRLI
ncbi:MAG: hypothetical protein ABI580_09945 [Burkholderiaceae bacterium]